MRHILRPFAKPLSIDPYFSFGLPGALLNEKNCSFSLPIRNLPIVRASFFSTLTLVKKEISVFFTLRSSWLILATIAMINGLAGWWAMHQEPAVNKAIQVVFYFLSGTTMISAVLYGMRSIAEEKYGHTLELLLTSPVSEFQIINAKFFANVFIVIVQLLTSLPVLLFAVFLGKGSLGQVFSGYIGLLLLGMASSAIVLFFSSITKSQIVAASLSGANIAFFLLLGFFSPYMDMPLKSILRDFSFYVRFYDFEKGAIVIKHVIFFLSVCVFYIFLSKEALASGAWRNR